MHLPNGNFHFMLNFRIPGANTAPFSKRLHSFFIYYFQRAMEIQSQSEGTVQTEGKFTGGLSCFGNKLTGNARAQC